jgi:hypothetical protein
MPFNFFRPKPGRFGVAPYVVPGRCVGTIANSTTTTFNFGAVPPKSYINRAVISSNVLATSGGAVTGVLQKYDASANAAVVLTAATSILTGTLVAREGVEVALLSTLTDAQRTLDEGDTLQFVVTAASTMTGQPTDLMVNVECLSLE